MLHRSQVFWSQETPLHIKWQLQKIRRRCSVEEKFRRHTKKLIFAMGFSLRSLLHRWTEGFKESQAMPCGFPQKCTSTMPCGGKENHYLFWWCSPRSNCRLFWESGDYVSGLFWREETWAELNISLIDFLESSWQKPGMRPCLPPIGLYGDLRGSPLPSPCSRLRRFSFVTLFLRLSQ